MPFGFSKFEFENFKDGILVLDTGCPDYQAAASLGD